MYFVYILRCRDKAIYVGATADVDRRVEQHQSGNGCAFTAKRRPVILVYSEEHGTLQAALARERQIKRRTRAKKEALIAGDRARLKSLGRKRKPADS